MGIQAAGDERDAAADQVSAQVALQYVAALRASAWVEAAQGYLSPLLLGYKKNPIWTADPKNTPYRDVAETAQTPAGIGKMGENAAAAIADFVVVDMFANYCTGREDVKTAMASAERSAKRIFR